MRPAAVAICALAALAACKDERAARPAAVEMTADAVGYYCQMELLEHEGPKGQIHLEGLPAPIFFSQVKDTIAYLHMPEQSHAVLATYVQDMAGAEDWSQPGPWIAAEEALYVVGSDRLGGMEAPEFVPFSDEASARAFVADHGGTLRRFAEIGGADTLGPEPGEEEEERADDIAARLKVLTREDARN